MVKRGNYGKVLITEGELKGLKCQYVADTIGRALVYLISDDQILIRIPLDYLEAFDE